MPSKKNTLSTLRSIGKSLNCLSSSDCLSSSKSTSDNVLKFNNLNIDDADEVVEKILDEEDCHNAFFVAPVNCHRLIEDEDEDGEEYWSKMRPVLIKRFSKLFGLKYGIDYAILRRGVFSLMVFLTKNSKGDWFLPPEILDFFVPDSADNFFRTLDFYYRHTDSKFFSMNAITVANKEDNAEDFSIKDRNNVAIEGVQVDISFLRSRSFKETDLDEDREHFTYNIFKEGILHAITMEHRIISFDDEDIDCLVEDVSGKICYRRTDD